MAKYEEPFEDTQSMFNEVIDAAGLSQFVNITVLTNNKAKDARPASMKVSFLLLKKKNAKPTIP